MEEEPTRRFAAGVLSPHYWKGVSHRGLKYWKGESNGCGR